MKVIHHTFVTERHYAASTERVFAALAEPEKKRLWYFEGAEVFEMDFRPGGLERARLLMGADTPFPGTPLESEGMYLDIVTGSRVVVACAMTLGGRRISATLCTFEVLPADGGTDLIFTHQGAFFEGADGPAMREEGWKTIFGRLGAALERA